ncbi:unnamed protein product [Kuraishia capsulata CBS 1993]|uniref:Uncharacterized protein n=1 Tax=Kuraishia capsulata CBS 1993 TaxID=1382522 RepID=W6MXQ0_9ASCO|nr:uncharacterized protein KUCA_T00005263001 [Kuraishia capsulata CBS 1993]CDK29275.1 unnamed protein product [Kuraishia capsulata CBS 1993]
MASVSELYQATATRFSVAGRVLYIPYVLFRIFLQWVHLTFLDTRTTIRHRASVLMASIFMAENDSKSLSEALDSTRYQNRLASTNLTRPVDEEIRYIFDPIENIIDIPRLASIVWLRTDYYYDRYVVHALFCFLHRFVGTRTPYLYRPSWISKPTSRNSPAQQADFEELDFQPREYCLNSMSRKTDSPGVSNFVSPAIRDRESRVASKSEQGSFANACPYITTQEPLLNFEKISSSYMSPEKPYKPISQEGHSSGASRTKKKLKIRFKRVVDVPVLSVTDYQSVRHAIEKLLDQPGYDDGSIGPNLVRFGWHCCATYDKRDGTGGSNGGTMRYL